MNLGIFLGIGESLKQMEKSGQKDRFISLYLAKYAKDFDKVYLFSYENESCSLPANVFIVSKKSSIHRYLYSLLIPIISHKQVNNCDIIRGFGLTSAVPALLTSKPFIFNWPYNYIEFLKIEKKYFLISIYYVLEKIAFMRAKIVLVATKQKLNNLTGDKFIYLPNGVDLAVFKSKGTLGKGIVFIGRLEKQKNLIFLLDAVSKLPRKLRLITFFGSGSQEPILKEYAILKKVSLNIQSPVNNVELPRVLRKFSIFALPSLAEGNPKVLLEAMATGLVPVVTNFITAREVVKNSQNGFITNYETIEFSNKLKMLSENSELGKKMSRNAVRTISENFNIDKLIAKEVSLIKDAALAKII